jgi:hypothetical protein
MVSRLGGLVRAGQRSSADERNGRALLAELSDEMRVLLTRELALARAELVAQARQVTIGGGALAAAGLLGLCGWLALLVAAGLGLSIVLPGWAAALIVAGALLLPSAVLAMWAVHRLAGAGRPLPLTTESLRKDIQVVREQARR